MLVEVKVKIVRNINDKTRRKTETYLVSQCEFFVTAEHQVSSYLTADTTVESFEIQSLRISPIKEIVSDSIEEFQDHTFIATLCDIFHNDEGVEKKIKYKVFLGAESLNDAHHKTQQLARQGYDMAIEGIKQVDYVYLTPAPNEQQ